MVSPSQLLASNVIHGGVSIASLAIVIVILVNVRDIQDNRLPVISSACPQGTCQSGMAITAGGATYCQSYTHTVGTPCTSTCYTTDAATTCNGTQACVSSDPTTCLGYCTITNYDVPLTQFDAVECMDKFVFYDFFKWDTPTSSSSYLDWVFYSDYAPECASFFGCLGYATLLRIFIPDASTTDWLVANTVTLTCEDILNMTNKACIQSWGLLMNEEISTPLYRNIFQSHTPTNLSAYRFQAQTCQYWYKCGIVNETALVDPVNLLGDKRSLTAAPDLREKIMARADDMGKKLGPHVATIVQRKEDEQLKRSEESDMEFA